VNFSSSEVRQIMGRHSSELEEILGYECAPELIHRDNLVMMI
jgi:glutamate 5-kinase